MATIGSKIKDRLKRFADALEEGEEISPRFTARTVKLKLDSEPYTPELVKKTRETLRASQAIFAQFLGVSVSSLQDWEQGQAGPHGAACRLMDEIRRHPEYWINALLESSDSVKA